MTILAGLRCFDGILLCADTEQTVPDILKTRAEKIYLVSGGPTANWELVMGGAGMVEFIEMTRDLLGERIALTPGSATDIMDTVR